MIPPGYVGILVNIMESKRFFFRNMIKTIRRDINDLHLVSSRGWSSLYSESSAMKNHAIILNYQLHYKSTYQDTSSIYLIWILVYIIYIRLYLQSHRSHLAQVKHILSSCFPNKNPIPFQTNLPIRRLPALNVPSFVVTSMYSTSNVSVWLGSGSGGSLGVTISV